MAAVLAAQTTPAMYTLSITPEKPTTQDTITLKLAGTWSDNCPPEKLKVALEGDRINVDMLLPGAEDGKVPECKAVRTDWQLTAKVGPLAAGAYKVYVRGVGYNATGGYARLGEFAVQASTAKPTDPKAGDGQKSGTTAPKPDPGDLDKPDTDPGKKPGEPSYGKGRTDDVVPCICVVLLDRVRVSDSELEAGRCGTVLWCDPHDRTKKILVSWPFLGKGSHDRCTDEDGVPLAYPFRSATWIDPRIVRLAVCFDACGTLRQGQDGCILLKAEDGKTYNLIDADALNEKIGPKAQFRFDDHIRVRGLLQASGPRADSTCLCEERHGDIHWPIIALDIPPKDDAKEEPEEDGKNECDGRFKAGDRVKLLVSNPPGTDGKPATALWSGTVGTVVYANTDKPALGVFVSWDGYTKGMDAASYCPAPPPPCPSKSGWPVRCDQIAPCDTSRAACVGDTLAVDLGHNKVVLRRGPQCPGGKHTLTGLTTANLQVPRATPLTVKVTPAAGIGGTWKGSVSFDGINPGNTEVIVCVDVDGLNLSDFACGKDVLVAKVELCTGWW